jgi:hypothetical protein
MTGLDVLLAVSGIIVTLLVVAGMILITPRGAVEVTSDAADSGDIDLGAIDAVSAVPTTARRPESRVGR